MNTQKFSDDLPLAFGMAKEPQWVETVVIQQIASYREACRLCWDQRRIKGLTLAMLASISDLYASHVTDYFHKEDQDKKGRRRRMLPAEQVAVVESILGNHAITQWLAGQKKLTIMERIISKRAA
jgi:hypothetical protein